MEQKIRAIVLAAGEGKRMHSRLVKMVHKVAGVPIVAHVLRAARVLHPEAIITVVGKDAQEVMAAASDSTAFVTQHERLGTGHACQQAESEMMGFSGVVIVLCGDAPLIAPKTLEKMLAVHREEQALATVLTARPSNVQGLGRIKRDAAGRFIAIVEEKDASPEEQEIREINAGFYCFSAPHLFAALRKINNNNKQREYMLTDVIPLLIAEGRVATVLAEDPNETIGINDRVWLSRAEEAMQGRIQRQLMLSGVTIVAPQSTYIEADVSIGRDTTIWPNCVLKGRTAIGEDCQVGPGTLIENSTIADCATILNSVVRDSEVGPATEVGPFAHLRPGTVLGQGVRVGNFVEIKKSTVGDSSKISHLSYVGDAEVGSRVNMGAGTVVVNYDGAKKHPTIIGDGAFVGCNSSLVAPLVIGKDAFVAAGSTLTRDVPAEALAVARARQENKEGWVVRYRRRKN